VDECEFHHSVSSGLFFFRVRRKVTSISYTCICILYDVIFILILYGYNHVKFECAFFLELNVLP